jgi:hypothetical protein
MAPRATPIPFGGYYEACHGILDHPTVQFNH